MGDLNQGIVHIIGPELGLTEPGMTIVCGDSHTSTHGAFGALAFGIGTSEVEHVLATQTLPQRRPKSMRVTVDGTLPDGVSSKDLVLAIIGRIGTSGGMGHVIEYAGSAVRALSMEGRMTVCNMSIEAGARAGMVGPDDTTFAYLEGRSYSPAGAAWEAGSRRLAFAPYRRRRPFRQGSEPRRRLPDPLCVVGDQPGSGGPYRRVGAEPRRLRRSVRTRSGGAGSGLHGSRRRDGGAGHSRRHRLHRLVHQQPDRRPASRGRPCSGAAGSAPAVRALVVPGSGLVKAQAEAEGLDRIFTAAGFEWRNPGCSMCLAMNPDKLAPGERCGVHLEPQLRRPSGPRRAHPSGLPRRRRRHRCRRPLRRPGRSRLGADVWNQYGLFQGRAVPLDRSDVDTDQIIPSDWLKQVERTGFAKGLFAEWRDDRDFVLNQPEYAGATILVAGPNFGTGSSREHAVWALIDYGFKAVVSPRFGDIFRNNCTKAGLVPAQVDPAAGRALLRAVIDDPALEITVDVERLHGGGAGRRDRGAVPPGPLHPAPPAGRLGRHRPDPPPRG